MTFTQHELGRLTRQHTAEEFEALKDSIARIGQLDPILATGTEIVSGWHRYRAALELGIEPRIEQLPEGADLLDIAIDPNLSHRHLSLVERGLMAASMTDLNEERGKKPVPKGKLSVRDASKRFAVSFNIVQRSRRVLMYCSDEVVHAVRSGAIGLPRENEDVGELEATLATLRREENVILQDHDSAKDDALKKALQEKEKEIKRRKKAESVARASDREIELATQLREAQEALAREQAVRASLEAQAEGGLGVAELLEPKVITQRDPAMERERDFFKKEAERERELRELSDRNYEASQRTMLEATTELQYLKGQLKDTKNASAIMTAFAEDILRWRNDAGWVAKLIKEGHRLDPAVENNVREVISRLSKLLDLQRDAKAIAA